MKGFLETCGGELAKLGRRKPSLLPAKSAGEESLNPAEDVWPEKGEETAAVLRRKASQKGGVGISEATMCMILDRFTPS